MIERTFGHFARVLVDIDLASDLRHRVLVESAGDGNSQIHFNANTDTSLSKAADNVNPSIDDQGFQLVTTRATKKATKSKTIRQNTYPLRSRAGTSKPFK